MDHPGVGFEEPTLIEPLDAILNDLAQEIDGDPVTFQELLRLSLPDLGSDNIANITNAMDYFRCVENNKVYDKLNLVDHLINVTEVLNLHTAMGTNRVPDQLIQFKQRLFAHKEELRRKGINTDKNFVGRTDDIERIVRVLSDELHSCRGVCICGLGGMGKTSLANEVCYRLLKSKHRWWTIRIDLRERESLLDLLSLTLSELHETFSSTDIQDMASKLWKAIQNIKRRTILLFDNIDGLLQSRDRRQLPMILTFFDDFLQKLDDMKSECQIKVLITSRQKLIPVDDEHKLLNAMRRISKSECRINKLVLEIELKPLTVKEAKQLYEKCVDEKYKTKGSICGDIVQYCGYCPLAIRSACSAINSGLLQPQVIRYNLKIGYEKGGLTHALQVNNCLAQTFRSLDDHYQKCLIRLTVFQSAKFDLLAASAVFGESHLTTMQPKMDLLALKTRHFVEITEADEYMLPEKSGSIEVFGFKPLKYSLHPLVYMFLKELVKAGDFEEEIQQAKIGFTQFFEHELLKIGEQMDRNCMKAWKLIEENKKHLMNLLKGDPIVTENTVQEDMKDRILLCAQMIIVGNLLLGDFHRINRINRMLKSSETKNNKLEMLFWKIEKANFFFDLDRNELVEKYLIEIEKTCNDITGKGSAMAPVFGCFFLLKGKLSMKKKQPKAALKDLVMAQKLFNEHRFVRHNYLYHITNIYEKIAHVYQMLEPPDIQSALDYLSAAFKKATEKVENFYNLDIPSFTASIGRCYYLLGVQERAAGNEIEAKKHIENSVRYYTKAMALDTQMNLHKYDNYADKLVKRAESYVELGLMGVSGGFSDAVKDIKEADLLRRKILQPPHYKCTHTPHLVGKFLFLKAQQEYERNQKGNAINHLWEGIMYYEITRDMIKTGGLHPIHLQLKEYEEIILEHLWGLQQAREFDKIEPAIKFYNDFRAGKFENERKKTRSERETIQNSEFVSIEDVKAEMMMAGPGQMTFTPVNDDESDSEDEDFMNSYNLEEVILENYKLDKVMDFDKLFAKMDNPDSQCSSDDDGEDVMEMEVKKVTSEDSLMDIQRDIEKISSKATVADLIGETDAVFDDSEKASSEELGKTLLSNMRRKSSGSLSLPSTPSQGPSIKEKRERFKRKRSRDPSMQKFLDDLQDLTSESGQGILKSTQSLSQDKSFEIEMPVLDYLSIVDTKDKETKKKMLERMHQKYPSVQEEHVEGEDVLTVEDTDQDVRITPGGRKRQLKGTRSVEVTPHKSSRDMTE